MAKKDEEIEVRQSSRMNTIMVGVLIGAGTGLIAALLLNRRAARTNREAALTAGEGIQLGVLVFGLLRAIASLGNED